MSWKNKLIKKLATRPTPIQKQLLSKIVTKFISDFKQQVQPHISTNKTLLDINYNEKYEIKYIEKYYDFFSDVRRNLADIINIQVFVSKTTNIKKLITEASCEVNQDGFGGLEVNIIIEMNGEKQIKEFVDKIKELEESFYLALVHEYNHFKTGGYLNKPNYWNPDESINKQKYYADWDEVKAYMQQYATLAEIIINKYNKPVTSSNITQVTKEIFNDLSQKESGMFTKQIAKMPKNQRDTVYKGIWTFITEKLQKQINDKLP